VAGVTSTWPSTLPDVTTYTAANGVVVYVVRQDLHGFNWPDMDAEIEAVANDLATLPRLKWLKSHAAIVARRRERARAPASCTATSSPTRRRTGQRRRRRHPFASLAVLGEQHPRNR
jgi:hypothetical protein